MRYLGKVVKVWEGGGIVGGVIFNFLFFRFNRQPRPQAQPLPLRGYCMENTVGNVRSGLAENAEKSE